METIEAGEALRAADALIIVGQLLAVLGIGLGEELRNVDRQLFADFRSLLPSSTGLLPFLRDHDLGGLFKCETLDPLEEL